MPGALFVAPYYLVFLLTICIEAIHVLACSIYFYITMMPVLCGPFYIIFFFCDAKCKHMLFNRWSTLSTTIIIIIFYRHRHSDSWIVLKYFMATSRYYYDLNAFNKTLDSVFFFRVFLKSEILTWFLQ